MKTFNDKHHLAITAARCVGLIRALFHEVDFVGGSAQQLLETEYVSLYSQLQDLAFNNRGEIKWVLLNEIEQQSALREVPEIEFHKTDYGIGIMVRRTMHLEVASKLEARAPGVLAARYDFPSVMRERARNVA